MPGNAGDRQETERKAAIENTIVDKKILTFADIAGLQDAKQALQEAIIMPSQFPELFIGKVW